MESLWFAFNGWLTEFGDDPLEEQNWDRFCQLLLRAEALPLEKEFGWLHEREASGCSWLWNLIALAHLQGGDLYAYQKMAASKPVVNSKLPTRLSTALSGVGLRPLALKLANGVWCTDLHHSPASALSDGPTAPPQDRAEAWTPLETFWDSFAALLEKFRLQKFEECRRGFAKLESSLEGEQQLEKALILYFSAGSCLLEGDQFGAQDYCLDLLALEHVSFTSIVATRLASHLDSQQLPELSELIRKRGGVPVSKALTPWQDFQGLGR